MLPLTKTKFNYFPIAL